MCGWGRRIELDHEIKITTATGPWPGETRRAFGCSPAGGSNWAAAHFPLIVNEGVRKKAPPDQTEPMRELGYLLASVVLRFQTVSDMPPEPGAGLLIRS